MKKLFLSILFLFLVNPAWAKITLLASNTASSSAGAAISNGASINSTGASLLVVTLSSYASVGTPTVSDSNSNTWNIVVGDEQNVGGGSVSYIAYAYSNSGGALVTGAGNTISVSANGFHAAVFMAFSGTLTSPSPLDQTNRNFDDSGSATTIQPGSITPTYSNELIITCLSEATADTYSINSNFNLVAQIPVSGGNHFGGAGAYYVQGTAAAVNPTWSGSTGTSFAANIASFEVAPSGGLTVNGGLTVRGGLTVESK